MPIVVKHTPAAAVVGQAGYVGGLGALEREMRKYAFAQQQQEYDAARQQQSQQFAALQNALGMQNQRQGRREAMAFDLARSRAARETELADEARRREWALSDRAEAERLRKEESELGFSRQKELYGIQSEAIAQRGAEDDARQMALARKKQAWDLIGAGTHAYNPMQRKEMDRVRGEMNTWKNNRDVPDDVRMAKLAELQQIYDQIEESPDELRPDERPKSTADKVNEWTHRETLPDGTTIVWNKEVRNGEERMVVAAQIDPQGKEIDLVKQAQERQKQKQNILSAVEKHKQEALKTYKEIQGNKLDANGNKIPPDPKEMRKVVEQAGAEYFQIFPEHLDTLRQPDMPQQMPSQGGDESAFFDGQQAPNPHNFNPTGMRPEQMRGVAGVPTPSYLAGDHPLTGREYGLLIEEANQYTDARGTDAAAEKYGPLLAKDYSDQAWKDDSLKQIAGRGSYASPAASAELARRQGQQSMPPPQQQPVAQAPPQSAPPLAEQAEPERIPNDGMTFDASLYDWRPSTDEEWNAQRASRGEPPVKQTKAERPPEGFDFPNGDRTKPPVPKASTVADLDRMGVKVGDVFIDANDGQTKIRRR